MERKGERVRKRTVNNLLVGVRQMNTRETAARYFSNKNWSVRKRNALRWLRTVVTSHTASHRQATSHAHASKSCTNYSLHLVQSTSRHTNVIMLYAVKCPLYIPPWTNKKRTMLLMHKIRILRY